MRIALTVAAVLASTTLGHAQTATSVANSASRSDSAAGAVAIGGGNATGGAGGAGGSASASSALTINNPATTSSTVASTSTIHQDVSGTQTLRSVPNAYAPGLAASAIETCLGSVSGGGSWVGTGFSFGTTIPDPGCTARLDSRQLWAMGLKKAAVARLCQQADIYASMPDVCEQYRPQALAQPAGSLAYTGGPIVLIDGKTGLERSCDRYDEVRQRCLQWTGAKPRKRSKHQDPVPPVHTAEAPAN